MLIRILFSAVLVLALAGCAAPPSSCHVSDVADLTVTFTPEGPVIPVSLNGHSLNMLVDTGAQLSLITPQTAKMLNIGNNFIAAGTGVNGIVPVSVTINEDLRFGRVDAGNAVFMVAAIDDATRPGETAVDGALGNDFLQQFAIGLDFPAHKMTLLQRGNCAEILPPWQGSFGVVKFTRASNSSPVIPVAIDGQNFNLIVDTGDDITFISTTALRKAGVVPKQGYKSLRSTSVGLGGLKGNENLQVFATLTVGAETFGHPMLTTGKSELFWDEDVDGLLGEDYIRERKILIDNSSNKIYLGMTQHDPVQ